MRGHAANRLPTARECSHARRTAPAYHPAMKKTLIAAVAYSVLASSSPVFASSVQLDGQLPMYPHAKADARESSLTPAAIAQGVPLVLLTTDSVDTVDHWYASNTPKSCTRLAQSGGVQYKCPGGSIMIYVHGSTQIALVPPMPHM